MMPSPCRIFDCESCKGGIELNCPGCLAGNDYLERRGLLICPLFDCLRQNGIASCEDCTLTICSHYRGSDATRFLYASAAGKPWIITTPTKMLRAQTGANISQNVSDRTIMRLRWYLLILDEFNRIGVVSVSSRQIADKAGTNAALVRKDLSYFGEFGARSFGYNVRYLHNKITKILHLDQRKHIVWLGAKRFMENAASLKELTQHNCYVAAVMDVEENSIGTRVQDLQVLHISSLPQVVTNLSIEAAVLALPPEHSQFAIKALADVGIKAVLNFSSMILDIPKGMTVRNIDITGELVALSFYCHSD